MPKLGRKDLFAPTLEYAPSLKSLEGLLISSPEGVEKVMVMLTPRQITALDKACLEIRQSTGMKFKRSMLIRSLIDAFLISRPSLGEAKSHEDITRKIIRRLGHIDEP